MPVGFEWKSLVNDFSRKYWRSLVGNFFFLSFFPTPSLAKTFFVFQLTWFLLGLYHWWHSISFLSIILEWRWETCIKEAHKKNLNNIITQQTEGTQKKLGIILKRMHFGLIGDTQRRENNCAMEEKNNSSNSNHARGSLLVTQKVSAITSTKRLLLKKYMSPT